MVKRLSAAGLILVVGASFALLFGVVPARAVSGASIFVGPANGTFTVGSTFTVSVYVNTGGQAINAIEANLSFPPDKLQVVSPTAGKSLIQIWVNQPTYSNENGSLKFQGTIPSPGINTESGVISTITFRVKSTGTATLRVSDTSRALLNDGRGTDVLGQRTSGIYNLILPPPAGPIVTSPTNSDQEKWYSSKSSVFSWEAAPGTEGFSYILNNSPIDDPDNISEGLKTRITYNDLADGIYYFHIKSLREGSWGGVTNFAVRIDGAPPANFDISLSPDSYTSNRRPIIDFETTDQTSGIDHYELKIISLNPKPSDDKNFPENETPFFIEATSPYSRSFDLGRYDVVVRAYDAAGNYFQATQRLTVANAIFEIVRGQGLRFGGAFTLAWPYAIVLALISLLILGYFARRVWIWHRQIEKHLEKGALSHPSIAPKIQELKEKQKEYGSIRDKGLMAVLALIISGLAFLGFSQSARAAQDARLPIEPPIVTLFPNSVSNDEILYIGGRSGAPGAQVIIYIQNEQGGGTLSHTAKTDKKGEWFYSLSEFLEPGKYVVWTQLKFGEELSPPSSKLDLEVARTAVQFGGKRISYENLYLVFLMILIAALLAGLVFILYHSYHHRIKKAKLMKEIKEAEESIRRGFLLLRKDIESELTLVRRAKMTKELAVEEKLREEKLLKDLEWVNGYIGKEVWDVEREV